MFLVLFFSVSVVVAFVVGLIAGYAGFCHWLLDVLARRWQ